MHLSGTVALLFTHTLSLYLIICCLSFGGSHSICPYPISLQSCLLPSLTEGYSLGVRSSLGNLFYLFPKQATDTDNYSSGTGTVCEYNCAVEREDTCFELVGPYECHVCLPPPGHVHVHPQCVHTDPTVQTITLMSK